MLFLLFSKHLPEEAGSGLNDYGLSAAPRYSWDPWSLVCVCVWGGSQLVFLTLLGEKGDKVGGGNWCETF